MAHSFFECRDRSVRLRDLDIVIALLLFEAALSRRDGRGAQHHLQERLSPRRRSWLSLTSPMLWTQLLPSTPASLSCAVGLKLVCRGRPRRCGRGNRRSVSTQLRV